MRVLRGLLEGKSEAARVIVHVELDHGRDLRNLVDFLVIHVLFNLVFVGLRLEGESPLENGVVHGLWLRGRLAEVIVVLLYSYGRKHFFFELKNR